MAAILSRGRWVNTCTVQSLKQLITQPQQKQSKIYFVGDTVYFMHHIFNAFSMKVFFKNRFAANFDPINKSALADVLAGAE